MSAMTASPDTRSGSRLKQNHVAAFEEEAVPHIPALCRAALRMAGDKVAAEDLVQDTLERAFRSFPRFEPGTNIRAWLFRIMANTAISSYRRQAVRQTTSLDSMEESRLHWETSRPGMDRSDVETQALGQLGEKVIQQAIADLGPERRTVVLLAFVEGFRYREIAEILQLPLGTVQSRLHRGRCLLQRSLRDEARVAGYAADAA